jgi:hypothetical protein
MRGDRNNSHQPTRWLDSLLINYRAVRDRPWGKRGLERWILREYPLLKQLQLTARFHPELTDENQPSVPIRGERLGLPPSAVQSDHQMCAQPLAIRILRNQPR